MKVLLLNSSSVNFDAYSVLSPQAGTSDADYSGVFAGRACYQSFNRPNPQTASDDAYLKSIIAKQHESVLSHSSAAFYIEGVSRSLTHELVRHRWLSFSQLSQRYVDESDAEIVFPPLLESHDPEFPGASMFDTPATATSEMEFGFEAAKEDYGRIVSLLVDNGYPIKRAREAARAVLPNAVETKLVVSGNLRAWRDFLRQRLTVGADYEIMTLAVELHRLLKEIAPLSFRDLDDLALTARSTLP